MTGGRASRAKGDRIERELVALHKSIGLLAERYPLSGASRFRGAGHDFDIYALGKDHAPLVVIPWRIWVQLFGKGALMKCPCCDGSGALTPLQFRLSDALRRAPEGLACSDLTRARLCGQAGRRVDQRHASHLGTCAPRQQRAQRNRPAHRRERRSWFDLSIRASSAAS